MDISTLQRKRREKVEKDTLASLTQVADWGKRKEEKEVRLFLSTVEGEIGQGLLRETSQNVNREDHVGAGGE